MTSTRRVLFVSRGCLLDDSNGAAVASRTLMQLLARRGFAVEALSGDSFESRDEPDVIARLAQGGWPCEVRGGDTWTVSIAGPILDVPPAPSGRRPGRPAVDRPESSGLGE